jgi:CelD/BcsL family acetyltransferase involved in cellulose biosynthesis
METLDRRALQTARAEIDLAFSRTRHVDQFCSSSAWTFSADATLMPPRELYCRRGEHGWALLARRVHEDSTSRAWSSLESLESAWCLASPLAAREGEELSFARELAAEWATSASRDVLFLSGLVEGSPLFLGLVTLLRGTHALTTQLAPKARRFRASLAGGTDGFLARRSSSFRERLRQAERKAARAGVHFEPVPAATEADAIALYDRLLAVEARSWKGLSGEGLLVPSMQEFYRHMLPMLAPTQALRARVGRRGGDDVAMIVGAVIETCEGPTYRGLQFSFDDAHRALSLGNLAQLDQIRSLSDEGVACYDLGSEVDYKRRWGEGCLETVTLVAVPHALRSPPVGTST